MKRTPSSKIAGSPKSHASVLLKTAVAFILAQGMTVLPLTASTPEADQVRQNEIKQQQLLNDAKKLVAQLQAMIDAYHQNGLGGDDLKALEGLQVVLKNLSGNEMKKVVEFLQQAQAIDDPKAAIKLIAGAYSGQKGISVRLKQLLADYDRIQTAREISDQLSQLAERQAANLQSGIELGQFTPGKKEENSDAAVKAALDAQFSEQKAINDELKIAKAKMEAFVRDAANKDLAGAFKKATEQLDKLTPNLDAAAESLKQGQFFKAATNEKTSRDELRQMARMVAPNKDALENLRDAEQKIAKMIEDEKALKSGTEVFNKSANIDNFIGDLIKTKNPVLKRLEVEGQTASALKLRPVMQNFFWQHVGGNLLPMFSGDSNIQADLAGRADVLCQDLQKDSAAASGFVRAAGLNMQDARATMENSANVWPEFYNRIVQKQDPLPILDEVKLEPALKSQKDAIANLEKALDKVKQDLALAEAMQEGAGDPVAKLQNLEKQTQELIRQQAQALQDTNAAKTPQQAADNAAKQDEIKQKTEQVQQQAGTDSPDGAKALQNAAGDMQKAEDAQKNAANPQAANAQQSALANLVKADAQLKNDLAKLQQTQQELPQEQKDAEELARIIGVQQKLEHETVIAAAQLPKLAEVVKGFAPRQGTIQADTDKLQKKLASPPQEAAASAPAPNAVPDAALKAVAAAVSSASGHMGVAKVFLTQANGKPADSAERDALADLYKAQDLLNKKINQDKTALGQDANSPDQQALADADQQIQQAQQDLQNAQDAMKGGQQGQNQQAQNDMNKAAADSDQAAADGQLPGDAQQALRQASQQSADAAAAAAKGDTEQAQANAAAAQQSLAQAQAAISQAQGGVASTPPGDQQNSPPGTQPGTQPGQPGQVAATSDQTGGSGDFQKGSNNAAKAKGQFLGLPKRDRAAIEQSQSEPYPREYAVQIEQYMQNLATESSK